MVRYGVLPYDSESDDEDACMMMEESFSSSNANPSSAVDSNVNDSWRTAHAKDANGSSVGDTTTARDEAWNDDKEQNNPEFLKKDAHGGWRQSKPVAGHNNNATKDSQCQWRQWDNNNSAAFVDTLNSTFTKLNNSIQERVQIEREKLAQQRNHDIQQIQILRENFDILKLESSQSNTIPESRQDENETGNLVIPIKMGSTFACERVDTTTRANQTVPIQSPKNHDTRIESNAAEDNSKSKTTFEQPEYVLKAQNLLANLKDLQTAIEPFSKDKSVSKQRLNMKKTICGKLNTLNDNAVKLMEVAQEVNAAIQSARQEDSAQSHAFSEMYLLDLLSSNIMQRIQADGFNGSRGDGFPLAAMIAQVAADNPNMIPVLEAHVYKVCPMAVPRFPNESDTTSEEELIKSLGMQQDKSGDFESWDRFASRTENTIAMVASIQASMPKTHSLFGGHQGAADWLKRFFECLPSTTPLPLLTAPVLYGFLSGAGCMLANQHEALFQQSVQNISNNVLDRLDKEAIGKPSFTRLFKLLENGFNGFQSKLPAKAIPMLYNATAGGAVRTNEVHLPVKKRVPIRPKVSSKAPIKTAAPADSMSNDDMSDDSEMIDASDDSAWWGSTMYVQPPNPFEAKQSQVTPQALSFGQSSGVWFCQKTKPPPVNLPKLKNKGQYSRSNNGHKKKPMPPCKFFAMGRCKFGSSCRFSHES